MRKIASNLLLKEHAERVFFLCKQPDGYRIIKEIDGVKCEPYEEVFIEAPDECIGSIVESLGFRRGTLENMESDNGMTKVHYIIPSRGLIGFMTNFLTMTKGYGIINHSFLDYRPMEGDSVGERQLGVLVSIDTGQTTAYALWWC